MMKASKYGIPLIIFVFIVYAWTSTPDTPSGVLPAPALPKDTRKNPPPTLTSNPSAVALPTTSTAALPDKKVVLDPQIIIELKPQIEEFLNLQSIVIKDDAHKKKWSQLLQNPHAAYRARKLLLLPTMAHKELQNQALEFLIEAMKSGNPNAQDALSSLIADQTIEGSNADRLTQQFKAELKAEALYAWSSHSPDKDVQLMQLLPGPVSQRIWQNVIAQQMNNISESELSP